MDILLFLEDNPLLSTFLACSLGLLIAMFVKIFSKDERS